MPVRGLIFDYGGVLWDMQWAAARELAQQHGLPDRMIVESLYGSDAWKAVEVGGGDRDQWLRDAHAALETHVGRPLPPLHQHWRERQMFIEPNIALIRSLRPPFKTAVLSNADHTLADRLRSFPDIWPLFDDVVCSADVRMAKPDPRIYALSAKRIDLSPSECVFVDDLESNVVAARAAGMQAIHFGIDRGDSLAEQFAALGVVPA